MSDSLSTGVYFFSNDLRIDDNPALHRIGKEVDQLLCVFCYPKWWNTPNQQNLISLGKHRAQFLSDALFNLNESLQRLGQTLVITDHSETTFLSKISSSLRITHVIKSESAGYYEQEQWSQLKASFEFDFIQVRSHTLFGEHDLPFDLRELPETFSKFRKVIENKVVPSAPLPATESLPAPPIRLKVEDKKATPFEHNRKPFKGLSGGENAAQEQLEYYFSGNLPAHYKEVRNALDGWDNSSKFSPWLANGNLSIRTLIARLQRYENEVQKNSSTYWLYFELLWREYFQWYAHRFGKKLFSYRGIKQRNPLTSYYPERFRKWREGNTPYPLVNACMRQLNETGYLSNRGRQIVASCLVNELQVDWRFGAAYFEHQLIDYDVASNWGNWQYLAGVGADPRDKRHFNLEKQTEMFDPDEVYQDKWGVGNPVSTLDSVDAADWPVS